MQSSAIETCSWAPTLTKFKAARERILALPKSDHYTDHESNPETWIQGWVSKLVLTGRGKQPLSVLLNKTEIKAIVNFKKHKNLT